MQTFAENWVPTTILKCIHNREREVCGGGGGGAEKEWDKERQRMPSAPFYDHKIHVQMVNKKKTNSNNKKQTNKIEYMMSELHKDKEFMSHKRAILEDTNLLLT